MIVLNLSESNPYFAGRIYDHGAEKFFLTRRPYIYRPSENDRIEKVRFGDTLNKIAWRVYDGLVEEPEKWGHLIMDANKIINPLRIESRVGESLIIPDIQLARVERVE